MESKTSAVSEDHCHRWKRLPFIEGSRDKLDQNDSSGLEARMKFEIEIADSFGLYLQSPKKDYDFGGYFVYIKNGYHQALSSLYEDVV